MKRELTLSSITIGLIIGVIMTAANVYLGLYAGMTVSASIPASVLAMGIYRGILRRSSILEANMVQTMASAGESLAAGIIFSIPALVIVGAWNDFAFWPTTLIAICGGLLGVLFMIPLRKALIIENKDLIYPEGIACAQVLRSGSSDEGAAGFKTILKGLGIGALFKFFSAGLGLFQGSVEGAMKLGNRVLFMGGDASPALLAVGYIVGLEVSALVLMGGAIAWWVAIPMMGIPAGMEGEPALDIAWTLWSTQVRYIGVGAMIVGGIFSLLSVRKTLGTSLRSMSQAYKNEEENREDLKPMYLMGLLLLNFVVMLFLYHSLIDSWGLSLLTTLVMIVASFLFVAVSSYVVGLVGSSNNPVSGMTISALLGTSALFLVFGFTGESAIISVLGVAGVVCCAACTAGDTSQDLKTGSIIGATPWKQQTAEIIGVTIPALVIAPVLSLLHSAYGIGTGLKAPQAVLFASITKALFGDGQIPLNLVYLGMGLGVLILAVDHFFLKGKSFRLHLMPIAVGIYLPVTLATPMIVGGFIKYLITKKSKTYEEGKDQGILLSSGFVAGEALMGVLVAIILYLKWDISLAGIGTLTKDWITIAAFSATALYLFKLTKKHA